MKFNNFSCVIFVLKCANTPKPKNSQEGKNVLIPPYCILLVYLYTTGKSVSIFIKLAFELYFAGQTFAKLSKSREIRKTFSLQKFVPMK